jgi:single-strand DNA-binding protein
VNYQKLIIVGNATKDAECKTARESEVVYTTFRVGVSDGKQASVFFPITVFGKQAEVVAEYVTKGREVLVEGRVEAREDGRMSVVADRVVFGAGGAKPAKSGYEQLQETASQVAEERG